MEMLKNGTEVIVNRCCTAVNMLTGNPVNIEKDTMATVIGVNDGAIYGYVRYMIDIPYDCLDVESDGHVKCWVLAEWVRDATPHDRFDNNED